MECGLRLLWLAICLYLNRPQRPGSSRPDGRRIGWRSPLVGSRVDKLGGRPFAPPSAGIPTECPQPQIAAVAWSDE